MNTRTLITALMATASTLMASSAWAQERVVELEDEARRAVEQRQWVRAAHAYHAANEELPSPGLKLREMFAWVRAERCDQAHVAAEVLLDDVKAVGVAREAAREVAFACSLRDAEQAVDKGELRDAERALERARSHSSSEQTRERLLAVASIIKRRRLVLDGSRPQRASLPGDEAWTFEGVDSATVAGALVYDMVATDSEEGRLLRPEDEPTRPRQIKDVRRRIKAKHWIIPTVYSATRLVTRTGFVLLVMDDPNAKKGHSVEARLVPQWASGSLGAKLRVAF